MGEDIARFAGREDDRNFGRPFNAVDVVDKIEFLIEHPLIEEQQSGKRLILRGGSDMFVYREMRQKLRYLSLAHFVRVAFAVKENVAPDPVDVRLLSADRVMFYAQMPAHAIQ